MIQIDSSNAGQTVDMNVGQVAELRLAENATTGFRWKVTRDGGPSCQIKEDFAEPGAQARPGQGGSHIWRISGVRPGVCELAMDYVRSWEPNAASANTFNIRIRVGD